VLSGNRNFEGRIHSEVRANYLMSPPLVVAFALAGRIDIDLYAEPLGTDTTGSPVFLQDIWPSQEEILSTMEEAIASDMYISTYGRIFDGDERWNSLDVPAGDRFQWSGESTYVRQPPYFENMPAEAPDRVEEIHGARVIAILGDSVTTDHISPAGSIKVDSPAGSYLTSNGVAPADFNSYGSRRGNHEVMVRGTFANVRIRNLLAPGTEGGFTTFLPTGEVMTIYDAAMRYRAEDTPLLVLAGDEYGSGSSRDWAAKGPHLQGISAVIARSYERIHRSNLIGMGILPLQFLEGESVATHRLTGHEYFDIKGIAEVISSGFASGKEVTVHARGADGAETTFRTLVRIDTPKEVLYYLHGGILRYVLRQLLSGEDDRKRLPGGLASSAQADPGRKPGDSDVEESSIESFPASDSPAY
jgi:aconitate hydratase